MDNIVVNRALISVSDKTNLIPFAKGLVEQGIEILSTGGTAKHLKENNIPHIEVSDYTGFPEMMEGRLKTLHPKIHGGILGKRDEHQKTMQEYDIPSIDLVVVNLYPFKTSPSIENIDIGGPTLIRAAAKNHNWVGVVVDPNMYFEVLSSLKERNNEKTCQNNLSLAFRQKLALQAFEYTAEYDSFIAKNLPLLIQNPRDSGDKEEEKENNDSFFPKALNLEYELQSNYDLRYGENPHQRAALYISSVNYDIPFHLLQGKPLSFNNLVDADTAVECVNHFESPACVIVKHANPCGVAIGKTLTEAYQKAYETDPTSAFGGIIAFNQTIEKETIQVILDKQFVEVIIVPEITKEALEILKQKPNIRVLKYSNSNFPSTTQRVHGSIKINDFDFKSILGALLIQEKDNSTIKKETLKCVTTKHPSLEEIEDLLFAATVCKYVKSNAIVYAKNQQTIGIGAGQMSRVMSSEIGLMKASQAGLKIAGSVMASDAFFPFRDSIDNAAKAGIKAIIQPGGSKKDDEVILAANEHGISMVFTGIRQFRH